MNRAPGVKATDLNGPGAFVDKLAPSVTSHLRLFLANWKTQCKGRLLPAKADIRPENIIPALPSLVIVQVSDTADPLDYRVRLSGTLVDEIGQRDLTNKSLREIIAPQTDAVIVEEFRLTVATGRPRLSYGTLAAQQRGYIRFERLLVPVGDDGKTVDHVFMVFGLLSPH